MKTSSERRHEIRINSEIIQLPVSFVLKLKNGVINAQVINYHYRGACLKINSKDYRIFQNPLKLDFYIGEKLIKDDIAYRVCWETIEEDGLLGIEFVNSQDFTQTIERAERAYTNPISTPTLTCADPTEPQRQLFFSIVNFSRTGMLLSTSLTNKHIFPGMELKSAHLQIPGQQPLILDLYIENARSHSGGNNIHYGVSLKSNKEQYINAASIYIAHFSPTTPHEKELFEFTPKKLKSGLTFRTVTTQKEYEEVLKLRYLGYKKVGKIQNDLSWEHMGDGLKNEGVVLAGFLNQKMISSVELRFSNKYSLRFEKFFSKDKLQLDSLDNLLELNKLVIHPNFQRTDIVVGMFQKLHGIAHYNGKPDVVFWADDKLCTLYKRLGANITGFSMPHPVVKNVSLNLMTLSRKTYEEGRGISIPKWKFIYELTHEYISSIGFAKNIQWPLFQKIKSIACYIYLYFKSFQKHGGRENTDVKNLKMKTEFIAPKMTEQHVLANVLLPYVLEAEDMIGSKNTSIILNKIELPRDYLFSQSNWISIHAFDVFIEEFKKYGSIEELQKRAGYRSPKKEIIGLNYYFIKHFLTPEIAFKSAARIIPKFNRTRTYKVLKTNDQYAKIRIGVVDRKLLPKDSTACINWAAWFDGYIMLSTGRPGKVKETKCCFKGDDYCEYEISWTKQHSLIFSASRILAQLGFLGLIFHKTYNTYGFAASSFLTTALILILEGFSLYFKNQKTKRDYNQIIEEYEKYQKEAVEKYDELQTAKAIQDQNYLEAKLIEEVSRDIQCSTESTKILNTTLDDICTRFDFRRAFLMLHDKKKMVLRVGAVAGISKGGLDLWGFEVDVSKKRDNPMVLSSVFHSGTSIIIQNVDEHRFQLNEISQKLVEALKTKSFCMVPIPSSDKPWGVLVADKGSEKNDVITRRDLVLLQRVAQILGLALDRQDRLDQEIRLRQTFQKFVPIQLQTEIQEEHFNLGGEEREIICMFLDIRDFTKLSSLLPPQGTIKILNAIFAIVQNEVSKSGGTIDKFLGDGVFVTWGSSAPLLAENLDVISCALNILSGIRKLNEKFVNDGLPPIKVGIGLHRGTAVVGNVGSNERMEFTSIGSTVNITSRLEGLCKLHNTELVVSESLNNPVITLPEFGHWEPIQNVSVRGLEKNMNIIILKKFEYDSPLVDTKINEAA